MKKRIALVGNQNCGKTTLFNILTGSHQHIGNFPGVTVEQKYGFMVYKDDEYKIIDLPGIYSLSPYSPDELVSIEYLLEEKIDLIINIIDATHLERNLYLTMQLMELNIPIILVFNMMDEVKINGHDIDIKGIEKCLQIPIISMIASLGKGKDILLDQIYQSIRHLWHSIDLSRGYMKKYIDEIDKIIEENCRLYHLPIRYCTSQIIERNENLLSQLFLKQTEYQYIQDILLNLENFSHTDSPSALIQMRYQIIDDICYQYVQYQNKSQKQLLTDHIDYIFTHRYLGIPLFIFIMLMIFYLTFYVMGPPLQYGMAKIFDILSQKIVYLLNIYHVHKWLISLIYEGILTGVGSILSFLPVIMILFFFLSLLEDSGYMARVAFIMDRPLRSMGLSGKSIVSMLIGFGCSVPAIMSTRTLTNKRDKLMTILLIPFMSCSAKLPIYSMIIAAFFPYKKLTVFLTIYGIGIFVAIVLSLLMKKTLFKGESSSFLLELPTYRFPTFHNISMNVIQKAKDFIYKAMTIILLSSIVIWFLRCFDFQFHMTIDSSQSILGIIGMKISPIFRPLGFCDWRISTALLTGITAKESVVSTLMVLTSQTQTTSFYQAISHILTPFSALSFLVFTLLYMPCVAAFATIKRELGSFKQALIIVLFQTTIAYFVSLCIYRMGSLLILT